MTALSRSALYRSRSRDTTAEDAESWPERPPASEAKPERPARDAKQLPERPPAGDAQSSRESPPAGDAESSPDRRAAGEAASSPERLAAGDAKSSREGPAAEDAESVPERPATDSDRLAASTRAAPDVERARPDRGREAPDQEGPGPKPRHALPEAAVAASSAESPGRHAGPEPANDPPAPAAADQRRSEIGAGPPLLEDHSQRDQAEPDTRPPAHPEDARAEPGAPSDESHVDIRPRGPLRRAVERAGGTYWGVNFAMSLIIAVMLLTVSGFAFGRLTGIKVLPDGPAARFWPAPRDFPVLSRSVPVSIKARSVQISAPINPVGNAENGAIDVPTGEEINEAGWYDKGPTPGEYGPAVIVGHVDSGAGPSVFHKLSNLRPGNRVEITRADHKVAVFEVNAVKRFDRDNLPADQIFEDFSRPALRLITCGGRWVGGTTGYADNVVVFASLVKDRPGGR
ncbi:class F sortase [Phytohabitans flavus]|uniref:class F sortase n=1 Tax=Phytohabitans flavus TaxID=1076124 RepID=UPI001563F9FC|nr:class F sortase [Phytohabitans flavus]